MLQRRRAGVLLHPTSLPGGGGNGRLGAAARAFADWLQAAGFSVWQTLPLSLRDTHGSPYASESVYAGDTGLLDGATLRDWGLLGADEAQQLDADSAALAALLPALEARVQAGPLRDQWAHFCREAAPWLEDFALYRCLRCEQGRGWTAWPAPLRERQAPALAAARRRHAAGLAAERLAQFLFQRQWQALREHARAHGILMFGDLPFFVAHDSADVWAQPQLFRLRPDGSLALETGVPPDYFAADGQLWHLPHYDWGAMAADGFAWWRARLRRQSQLYDILRIDHFRGIAAAWEVPAGAATALDGRWAPGPGLALLRALREAAPELALVAEDLGHITDDVRALLREAELPGMRVLQFGFDGKPDNPHLPRNCDAAEILYSGTHDNDTLQGWYQSLDAHTRALVQTELDCADAASLNQAAISAVLDAAPQLAMLPLQDLLGLDSAARMNVPGRSEGNWAWRLERLPDAGLAGRLREQLQAAARL